MLPPLPGSCTLAAIATAPASIIKWNYFFDHNHLWTISALRVQYGIQAFTKFKRPECTRLHLRELQFQKFSRGACPRMGVIAPTFPLYYISRPPLSQNPPSTPDQIVACDWVSGQGHSILVILHFYSLISQLCLRFMPPLHYNQRRPKRNVRICIECT